MSNQIEQETLSSGAMYLMTTPVEPNNLSIIWDQAIKYMMNDGSKEIQNAFSTNNLDAGYDRKKPKIIWTPSLYNLFLKAFLHFGTHKATPKRILDYMSVKFLTKSHVASKLQKYRLFLKKVNEEGRRQMSRTATNSNSTSSCHIKPPHSYNDKTSLRNNNLSVLQSGFGLGQSTYDLSQTESNLLPSGFSKGILTLTGKERRDIFEISQEFQTPTFGQYGTTSDVLGTDSNLSPNIRGSSYAGITVCANGDLLGHSGNGNGSLGGLVHETSNVNGYGNDYGLVHDTSNVNGYSHDSGIVHDTSNVNGYGNDSGLVHDTSNVNGYGNGFLDTSNVNGYGNDSGLVHDTSNVNGNDFLDSSNVSGNGNGSLGGLVHDTSNVNGYSNHSGLVHDTSNVNGYGNDFLDGIRVHGTVNENGNGSFGGISVYGNGLIDGIRVHGFSNGNVNGSLGGTRVHGIDSGNGSLGQNFGGNNWNFNNNMSYHGSSASGFPSALSSLLDDGDQSHNNFIAQTDDVIHVQEKPSILNDHHGANRIFCDTINSQFDQNKAMLAVYSLEDIDNSSFNNGGCMEKPINFNAANSQTYFPSHDMNITNQGDCNEDILNSNTAISEMHVPPLSMSITDQGDYNEEIWNLINSIPEMRFSPWDMNITNQANSDEEPLTTANLGMYFPPQDINITNQDHGVADLTEPPLPFDHDSNAEDVVSDYLLDHERI